MYDAMTSSNLGCALSLSSSSSVLLLSTLGFHSYSVLLFGIAVTCAHFYVGPLTAWTIATLTFQSAPLILLFGCHLAAVFRELKEKKQILEALLDRATDGFCRVEAATGIIRSVSPQLQNTFGTSSSLVGKCMYELVHGQDHSEVQKVLEGRPQMGQMKSKLVTCIKNPSGYNSPEQPTFDVEIIPFATSTGMLEMCFRVQGEVRMYLEDKSPSELFRQFSPVSPTRSSSQGSASRSPEKKAMSEVSFAYTSTESMVSRAVLSEKGVQTDELIPASLRRDMPKVDLLNRGLPEQLSERVKEAFHVTSSSHSHRPPLLPEMPSQAVCRMPRRRPTVRREMSTQKRRSLTSQVPKAQSVWPSQIEQASVQCVVSEANSLRYLPQFTVKRAKNGRKRLGRDVSKEW